MICKRAARDKYMGTFICWNVAREENFPLITTSRLNNLFHDAFGGSQRKRLEPFRSIFFDTLMTTNELSTLKEVAPCAPLAIVDFVKEGQREWSIVHLEMFFKYIIHTPRNGMVIIVIFVEHGHLICNVVASLLSLKDVSIHLEYGSYAKGEGYIQSSRFCSNEKEQIIVAGLKRQQRGFEGGF